jgi:hypothetical protein
MFAFSKIFRWIVEPSNVFLALFVARARRRRALRLVDTDGSGACPDMGNSPTTPPRCRHDQFPFGKLGTAIKEWVGLIAYRVLGRTDGLFPAP